MLRVPVTLIVFLFFGSISTACRCSAQVPTAAPSTTVTAKDITDPALGDMKAFSVHIPSGWQFRSTVLASADCGFPSAVFRTYSRDGLTDIALLPMFTWQVQDSASPSSSTCLHMNRELSAKEFLDEFQHTLDSPKVIGPLPITPAYQQQFDTMRQKLASSVAEASKEMPDHSAPAVKGDIAALRIETLNGTFLIEERLRVRVWCLHQTYAKEKEVHSCYARLDMLRAPKGELDKLIALVDDNNLTDAPPDEKWGEKLLSLQKSINLQTVHDIQPSMHLQTTLLRCQAIDFGIRPAPDQYDYGRNPLETNYMAQRMAGISPSNVFDWDDFVLDFNLERFKNDGCSGQSLIHTWSSATGQSYRTANVDANPNGILPGAWTDTTRSANPNPQ